MGNPRPMKSHRHKLMIRTEQLRSSTESSRIGTKFLTI